MRGLPLPVTDTNIVGSEKKVYNDVESNTLQWRVVSKQLEKVKCNILVSDKSVVNDSARQNINLLEILLLMSRSNLIDDHNLQYNKYLSEQKVDTLKRWNRADQFMDVKSDLHVFSKYKFNNIDVAIKSSYDDNRVRLTTLTHLSL